MSSRKRDSYNLPHYSKSTPQTSPENSIKKKKKRKKQNKKRNLTDDEENSDELEIEADNADENGR
jgi:hypothetical protein